VPAGRFAAWLARFLPGLADGEPAALFRPAIVSDSTDGQIAHLHGLNLSRAWCWRRIAEVLPADDPRAPVAAAAARTHAAAGLPHVVGGDYMVEHWLAAYAVLLLS
jgi:TctA family transporter